MFNLKFLQNGLTHAVVLSTYILLAYLCETHKMVLFINPYQEMLIFGFEKILEQLAVSRE